MSASREKKNRQEVAASGVADPKTARQAQEQAKERRSNRLYAIIAIAFVVACVVMTDAAGVRRAAGRQAALLNKLVQDMIASGQGFTYERLKELLGHTPFEVLMGALLGGLLAVLIM